MRTCPVVLVYAIIVDMIQKNNIWLAIVFLLMACCLPATSHAASRLSGRILLSVQQSGEAWYVYPVNGLRYYLGRPDDAFRIMRELGLGISEADFVNIPADTDVTVAASPTAQRLAGRIILQVEKNGEAWYINPVDLRKYYLGRPADAFAIMRRLGLGISISDLALIRRYGATPILNQYISFERKSVATAQNGSFMADIITIDLANPKLKILSLAASSGNCTSACPALPLASYYETGRGFAAINGTYFDTGAAKRNYYFFPLYDSLKKVFINEDQLKYWTTGPIMAFDTNNRFYYFKDAREFKSVADFQASNGVTLQAAIGNKPRLVEQGLNYLIDWEVDDAQRTVKTLRNAIGYANNKVYLVVAEKATVPDLAEVMIALGSQYALNLDGGGSTALIYDGEYKLGPGRNVPNALVFSQE